MLLQILIAKRFSEVGMVSCSGLIIPDTILGGTVATMT